MDHLKLKIARHEIGHAVMALICRHNVEKVSLKEIDSPQGTDKYLAFTKIEPLDKNTTRTLTVVDFKVMIALGGYASEILFYDVAGIGGDDLTVAVKLVEDMLQVEDFQKLVSKLPEPSPDELKSVKNPMVRTYVDYKFNQAVYALTPLKNVIHSIAEELYKKEELSGVEFEKLFDSLAIPNSN